MNVQKFLEKHKDYYLAALSNTIVLEVNCQGRNGHVTNEEIKDLKDLGYTNVLSSTDMCMMTCGYASFSKTAMSRDEKITYALAASIIAPDEDMKQWTLDDIDHAISEYEKAEALGAGSFPYAMRHGLLKQLSEIDVEGPVTIILMGNGEVQVGTEGNVPTNYQL